MEESIAQSEAIMSSNMNWCVKSNQRDHATLTFQKQSQWHVKAKIVMIDVASI